MGRFSGLRNITHAIDNTTEIIKKATIDKDTMLALDHELQNIRAQALLSGVGASITKFTICGLIAAIVITGLVKFIVNPADLIHFKDFAIATTPILGMLVGAYAGGKTIQRINRNNNK